MDSKFDSKQVMAPEKRLKLLEGMARRSATLAFLPGFQSYFSSLSPLYPIAFMYQQAGLYYYSSSCCVPSPFHNGVIISDAEITDLGCNSGTVVDGEDLNEGITGISVSSASVSAGGGPGTRTGYSLGIHLETGTAFPMPQPADVLIGAHEPGYMVTGFREYGTDPVCLTLRGNIFFGEKTGHVLYLVTFVESSNRIVMAHAVEVADATTLATLALSRLQTSGSLPVILPDLATVADPENEGDTLDLLITNYAS